MSSKKFEAPEQNEFHVLEEGQIWKYYGGIITAGATMQSPTGNVLFCCQDIDDPREPVTLSTAAFIVDLSTPENVQISKMEILEFFGPVEEQMKQQIS